MKYRFTDAEVVSAVAASRSLRQVLIRFGMNESGGNYTTLKKRIASLSLDTSHFVGKGWMKGRRPHNALDAKTVLRKGTKARQVTVKRLAILSGAVDPSGCAFCGRSEWRNDKLVLELDHINGVNTDNRPSNLRLLCPNCHSQTPGWRGRKK
jgi:hypothetical protein